MRVLPKTDESYPPMLLARTHYGDDDAWRRVRAALDQPWVFDEADEDEGRLKEEILCVDDPVWAEATPGDILAALTAPEDGEEPSECGWDVVFLADRAGMEGAEPTLLAVSTDAEETEQPFRIPALEVPHEMHCNLSLANMDFSDFVDL
ncbi:hypothetical protein ABT121_40390 [Streptomyces sp. NPDC001928]|uniref:DUF6924 domain-containing protein n=1 Tax=Streptomyces sp. NPDC001928 TaxID=3154404 RepID=UPI00331D7A0D